ncbi:MAG: hypothetical protein Q9221_004848 [Calogaya cf. arnoldii]
MVTSVSQFLLPVPSLTPHLVQSHGALSNRQQKQKQTHQATTHTDQVSIHIAINRIKPLAGFYDYLCPKTGKAIVAYPKDQTGFTECTDGESWVHYCPAGTAFNPTYKICVEPYDDAPGGGDDDVVLKLEVKVEGAGDGKFDHYCPEDTREPGEEILIPHLDYPWKYLVCVDGVAEEHECKVGEVYTPLFKHCTPPQDNDDDLVLRLKGKGKSIAGDHWESLELK